MSVDLNRPIARNLDEPMRIVGLSPLELASCAVFYASLSPLLRGVPFSALLSLGLAGALGVTLLILNRTFPPMHGLYWLLQMVRPRVTPVMAFGSDGLDERRKVR